MKRPELLAPVGNFEMLSAAIDAGADAVYLGIKDVNMRSSAKNFSLTDLNKAVKLAHDNNVKVYVTLNTIIFEKELKKIERIIDGIKRSKAEAIIAWDLGILSLADKKKIQIHLSTQASVSNSLELNEYKKKYNIKRVVLARECTLEEIKDIKKKSDVELEVFCHGAMCVSESGRCFMSQFQYGKSANRGECLQPCRREYNLTDKETGEELSIKNNFVLSPKDLCTIHLIDKLIRSGISSLKIEGRARSPEYVHTVVKTYKEAIRLAMDKKLTLKKKKELTEKLRDVFNRDFSKGFFQGRPINDFWDEYGGKAKYKKKFLGKIINYYPKAKTFYGKLNSGSIKSKDTLWIIGPTTGIHEQKIESLRDEKGNIIKKVNKGETFTTTVSKKVRKNDKVYLKVKT